jgi:hypothetical protein
MNDLLSAPVVMENVLCIESNSGSGQPKGLRFSYLLPLVKIRKITENLT